MKNLFWDESLKKSLFVSIFGGIIFIILIEPIVKLIYSILTAIADNFISGIIDNFYQSASLGHRNELDFMQFFILIFLIIAGMVVLFTYINFILKKRKSNSSEDFNDSTIDSGDSHSIKKRIKELNEKEKSIRAEIKSSELKIEKNLKKLRILKIPYYISAIILILILTRFLITGFIDLQLNTSFTQRLTVLRPDITEAEYLRFKADWAKMNSREDYLRINSRIDSTANHKNIKLPNPLFN